MNHFKRALTSIIRRIPKTMILLLIVLILGNIMLSSLLIVKSVDGTKEAMLRELPPIVSLAFDFEAYQKAMEDGLNPEDVPWITFDDLAEIERASGQYIKTYDYSIRTGMQTESLKRVETQGGSFTMPGMLPTISVMGTAVPVFTLLETGDAEIIKGRTFSQEELDKGSHVIIVSEELADVNDLVVGDVLTIDSVITTFGQDGQQVKLDNLIYDFEVVGILQFKNLPEQENQNSMNFTDMMERERVNNILAPNNFIRDYTDKTMEIMRDYFAERGQGDLFGEYNPLTSVSTINYVLNSSEDFEQFVQRSETALNNNMYTFTSQEDNFKSVAQPLESMKGILNYAFYITLGSSVVVLALVLFAFMRDRKKEIGIYLALGERRMKIILQLVIETIAVGIVGAALAVTSGSFLASVISKLMLPAEIAAETDFNFFATESYLAKIDYNSIVQSFKIGLDATSIIYFFVAITVTIIVAQLIASVYILRFDPKKIMM